jgi:hypothetical protein
MDVAQLTQAWLIDNSGFSVGLADQSLVRSVGPGLRTDRYQRRVSDADSDPRRCRRVEPRQN